MPEETGPLTFTETAIYAVHISTSRVKGGLAFGYLGFSHPVYAVVYCQRLETGKYRRVGVGRIFGKEAVMEFEKSAEEVFDFA